MKKVLVETAACPHVQSDYKVLSAFLFYYFKYIQVYEAIRNYGEIGTIHEI